MKIIIGADTVSSKTKNREAFINGDLLNIVSEKIASVLKEADFRIMNLEKPLCDTPSPIEKNGPHMMAPTATVSGYKALQADLLTLANNHILDHGERGLLSTLKALNDTGIAYVGCGTPEEAAKPYIFEKNGEKIGVYACAEHEFSIANEERMGANPFDPLECPDRVARLKDECDYVIVLYHGGRELYRYPLPQLQKNCRKLIEKGADLVICQHSHCVGCGEDYMGGKIIYGQGNFIFNYPNDEYGNNGMLVSADTKLKTITYIPLLNVDGSIKMAEGEEAAQILAGFNQRSEEIKQEGFVAARLKKEAKVRALYLARCLAGNDFFYKVLSKVAPKLLEKTLLKKSKRLKILNLVACESHREILISVLED